MNYIETNKFSFNLKIITLNLKQIIIKYMNSKKMLLSILVIILVFTSCKKDRTCLCTVAHTNFTGTTVNPNQTTTYKKIKKSEAKDLCQNKTITDSTSTISMPSTGTYGQYTSDAYTCKLK
jgi:hypothetical protein